MNTKHCNQCNTTKEITEFSKCRANKDGLQWRCKSCNKKNNDKYRVENKEYWSYTDGYFSDKSKWEYIRKYQKADKTIKVYQIDIDGKYYIGATRTYLHVRMNQHLNQWRYERKGLGFAKERRLPALWEAVKHKSEEDWKDILNNVKIVEETLGGWTKMLNREKFWIDRYKEEGKILLNTIHNR